MAHYFAVVHQDEGTALGAYFPDFPGVATAADTMPELLSNMEQVLAIAIEEYADQGLPIPEPASFESVQELASSEEPTQLCVLAASVALAPVSRRVNITLPENLLQAIDKAAAERGTTRSGFLSEAARNAIVADLSRPTSAEPSRRNS